MVLVRVPRVASQKVFVRAPVVKKKPALRKPLKKVVKTKVKVKAKKKR